MTLPVLPHAPFKTGDRLDYNLPFVADVEVGPSWGECKHDAEHYVVSDPYSEDDIITIGSDTRDLINEDRAMVRHLSSEGGRGAKTGNSR